VDFAEKAKGFGRQEFAGRDSRFRIVAHHSGAWFRGFRGIGFRDLFRGWGCRRLATALRDSTGGGGFEAGLVGSNVFDAVRAGLCRVGRDLIEGGCRSPSTMASIPRLRSCCGPVMVAPRPL
jgi:hypothetical protein